MSFQVWRFYLWLCAAVVVSVFSSSEASYLCTALVNISFTDPETNETVWQKDESGLYGQDSPKASVTGEVVMPQPVHGCDPDTFYQAPTRGQEWIALIQRGNGCTFTEKINIAAKNGAVGVVIYNNDPESENRVIQMSHPGTGNTVAIMVGNIKGLEIVSLIRSGIQVTMTIEVGRQHGPWMSHYSVFFVSISFFIVTAATVGYFIFYSARRFSSMRAQNRKQKQLKAEAKKAISQLQVRTVKNGDKETGPDADACAVCIEAYKPGDVLSILTCNHFFHKSCIEPWLLEHRTCPMCKCDILKALGVEPDIEEPSIMVPTAPEFRNFTRGTPEMTEEEPRSETTSSGYASVQDTEEHAEATLNPELEIDCQNEETPQDRAVRVNVQPQYDNLGFEGDESNLHVAKT
ncbi:E3 ubiquitin-protein ligase RNF128 isoform X1 [Lepisosteus oculatus]|uniref:E3 ubiquitin-protein ligase RNF128 isoform X1 n=1 Tax=Lepisosteus oculatus TaxID=7918 RepID=UPI00371CAF16